MPEPRRAPAARPTLAQRLRAAMPSREQVLGNRWLRWLAPSLQHPRLWHLSRRGIALGLALGVFFGLLIPIAQIPASVAAAVVLRANVPSAVVSTLVTNPVTFGPVYYAAWRLGKAVLGEPVGERDAPPAVAPPASAPAGEGWWGTVTRQLGQVGKPLVVGLAILACVGGLLTYGIVSAAWHLKVRLARRRRRRRR